MGNDHLMVGNILISAIALLTISGAQSQTIDASCYIFGTEHVLTFDRERIDFTTDLELTAARVCPPSAVVDASFDISITNEFKYTNVDSASQVQCVKVQYGNTESHICADQTAMVDGENVVDSIQTVNGRLMVYFGTKGRELAIQVDSSLIRVSITTQSTVTITLPESYQDKLCGLCGNYDGNANNDLKLANGSDVSSNTNTYVRGADIAQSHAVTEGLVEQFVPSDCYNVYLEEMTIMEGQICGVYEGSGAGAFDACVINGDSPLAKTFLDICKYDYCENYLIADPNEETTSACGDVLDGTCTKNSTIAKEAVNSIMEVFVDVCRDLNIDIGTNWRAEYNADLVCASGTYTPDGPYCPDVCGLQADRCSESGVDGCECGSGESKEGDVCVPSVSCGCSDSNTGDYYRISEWWLDESCTRNFTCVNPNDISVTGMRCSPDSDCSPTGCVCKTGFVGDGSTCDRSCVAGQQPTSSDCENCPMGTYKESEGINACTPCTLGQITDESGSTSPADCRELIQAPEASNAEIKVEAADASFSITAPSDSLPNGLPFGTSRFRTLWASTNGVVSFGDPFIGRAPMNLETDVNVPLLAPFWLRQDMRVPGRVSPLTNGAVEMSLSTFNKLDSNQTLQAEAESSLSQILVLLSASGSYRAQTTSFVPNFATVITWKNTVPNPAFLYARIEALYYQCVIVTNGDKTYAIYIYPSGGIILQSRFQLRLVHMGYNVQDLQTQGRQPRRFNYYKSRTPGMADLDTDESNTDVSGRWVFEVANYATETQYSTIYCIIWYIIQRFYLFPEGVLEPLANPCPCNQRSAITDERFYYDFSAECAYSLNRRFSFGLPFFQKCCYYPDGGNLITDPARAGFPILFHPLMRYTQYEVFDYSPYLHCCRGSDNCNLYREYRPVDQCDDYRPPRLTGGFGDPHIFTLDNGLYTYNPVGEFWMIKSDHFSMQTRMIQSLSTTNQLVPATQFGAFVMKSLPPTNSSVVQVEINNNRTDYEVLVDGASISNLFDNSVSENQVIESNGIVLKKFNGSITVSFDSGFSFRFSIRHSVLSIQSFIPDYMIGFVDGLVGHYDGDMTNDLTDRSGRVVCVLEENCTNQVIHDEFGETWRISQEESLFTYKNQWTTETYTDLTFRPIFELDSNDTSLAICGDDLSCMFDIFMTNDTDLGTDTMNTRLEVVEKADVLGTIAPTVSGPSRINATVNDPVSVSYCANYSGNYSVELHALSIPDGATFERDPADTDGCYMFDWTPTDLTAYSIRLSANETARMTGTAAVSPIFEVSVKLSDDCPNGAADFDILAVGGLLSPTFCIVQCVCDAGWIGSRCDEDYNGCVDSPCLVGNCTDIPAGEYDPSTNTTYTCDVGDCPDGYERKSIDGVSELDCSDFDECINGTDCVNADCINFVGSFTCQCQQGYVFANASTTECIDVNECSLAADNCEQLCANTDGGFNCSCNDGYTLDQDGYTCTAAPTTEQICNASMCAHTCLLNGTCTCPRGQELNADGMNCDSINECNNGDAMCVIESGAVCHDQDVGYECRCPLLGYRPLVNNYDSCEECDLGTYGDHCIEICNCGDRAKICNSTHGCADCNPGWIGDQCAIDINECADSDRCGPIANCTNIPGSFYCLCPEGYANQNSTHCENIDECTTQDPCSRLAACNDTEGSFSCTCGAGYTGDGIVCYDENECSPLDGSDPPCVTEATCKNEAGSFRCQCPLGYHGDGRLNGAGCLNDNECNEAYNVCGGMNNQCFDTPGSYVCRCKDGYTGDGVTCVDIDECTEQTYNCTTDIANAVSNCNNSIGNYECYTTCAEGYNMTTDNSGNITCVPVNECSADVYPCDIDTEVCRDTANSFECDCLNGFERDNSTCVNIDECSIGNFTCDPDPDNGQNDCVDYFGGYECNITCNRGHEKTVVADVTTCEPINECLAAVNPCTISTERCEDTPDWFECVCLVGYERNDSSCVNIDDCSIGNFTCDPSPDNGQIGCVDTPGSYECHLSCNDGYDVVGSTCEDINECNEDPCDAVTETCVNAAGSYQCVCREGYANESNFCMDINECLNSTICGGLSRRICMNLQPFYNCSCKYGYKGEDCETVIGTAEFIEAEQVFGLEFNTDWAAISSEARTVFDSLMSAALMPMYDVTNTFLGVNILAVSEYANTTSARRKRATTGSNTIVSYHAVFSENVDNADIIHKALDYLISNNYQLTFNETSITDRLMLAYPGVFPRGAVTCDTMITVDGTTTNLINCQGRGTCEHNMAQDYPMCVCEAQYEGYNCGIETNITTETGNLLALWVSVAVAGALLLGGLLACTLVMVYQRRKRSPQLHRNPRAFSGGARAPAIFNPTSRLPAEAFNYQFPAGSIRDDLSDSSSTISGTTHRTQRTEGRIGSTVPFAPRWPRAYYAQLGDPDDN